MLGIAGIFYCIKVYIYKALLMGKNYNWQLVILCQAATAGLYLSYK